MVEVVSNTFLFMFHILNYCDFLHKLLSLLYDYLYGLNQDYTLASCYMIMNTNDTGDTI